MAKRGAHVMVEHREPLDAQRLVRLFERCGPARYEGRGAAVTPADRQRWAATAEASGWAQAYAWDVPGPAAGFARVNLALRAGAIPLKSVDPASWLHLACDLAFDDPAEGAWLADYLRAMGDAFGLAYAFADTEHHLKANPNADPRKLTWPIMLLGPDHVQRIGEERIRGAPALVQELGPQTYLVQVSEAPLAARARALDALAEHLGRTARR
jgi:hypothetical protein